jgi:hypothetical protein
MSEARVIYMQPFYKNIEVYTEDPNIMCRLYGNVLWISLPPISNWKDLKGEIITKTINFRFTTPLNVSKFMITEVGLLDHVQITLNKQRVYQTKLGRKSKLIEHPRIEISKYLKENWNSFTITTAIGGPRHSWIIFKFCEKGKII